VGSAGSNNIVTVTAPAGPKPMVLFLEGEAEIWFCPIIEPHRPINLIAEEERQQGQQLPFLGGQLHADEVGQGKLAATDQPRNWLIKFLRFMLADASSL